MLHNRASQKQIVSRIMNNANGIGESKAAAKRESDLMGQNGQSVSSKTHSISSTQNLRTITNQVTEFINQNYQGRPLGNIDKDSVKEWVNSKIEDGVSLSTVNTYLSGLGKMSDNLNQLGYNGINRGDIIELRKELIESHGSLQSEKMDRTNDNSQLIVQEMNRDTPFGLSASLQLEAGLRVDDALNLDKLRLNDDNTILVSGSKNGLDYTTAPISQELANKLREGQEMGYKVNYSEYRETLKEVVINTGQEWNGTHSLRYDYANNAHNENLRNGITPDESKSLISLNMGHSREEITEHYLKS